ncbi:hypothetical protein FQA39_LY11851 [Lamprigera yunnana]|nr:hypothetical protein FQA39_LY11851 [Lamprigera yunnana]
MGSLRDNDLDFIPANSTYASGSNSSETEASKFSCNRSDVRNLENQEEPKPNVIALNNVLFRTLENNDKLRNEEPNNSNVALWQYSTVVPEDVEFKENGGYNDKFNIKIVFYTYKLKMIQL